jgi:hypothetical protein
MITAVSWAARELPPVLADSTKRCCAGQRRGISSTTSTQNKKTVKLKESSIDTLSIDSTEALPQ